MHARGSLSRCIASSFRGEGSSIGRLHQRRKSLVGLCAHRLTQVDDSAGNRVGYTLDAMGNRTAENWKDGGGTLKKTLSRTIDALNRVQQVVGGMQ